MSGWNNDFAGPWLGNSGVDNGVHAIGNANWTFPASVATNATYGAPVFDTNETEGDAILKERIAVLTSGFNGVNATDVLAAPSNYFINNFWDIADVEHYGHIAGAHRIKPLTVTGGEILNLDPDKTIVTYCWTGQTSSMVTAYLKVLGYDEKSLKFGTNNMIYTTLESHQFTAPGVDHIYE